MLNTTGYCYHSVSLIIFGMFQSNHVIRLPLYQVNILGNKPSTPCLYDRDVINGRLQYRSPEMVQLVFWWNETRTLVKFEKLFIGDKVYYWDQSRVYSPDSWSLKSKVQFPMDWNSGARTKMITVLNSSSSSKQVFSTKVPRLDLKTHSYSE